ncbi:lysophospholipid acyltransferase family protein [Tomitella biformata]|nr:lysophospholipid acyltransferase family protein [Tomitella biformata]
MGATTARAAVIGLAVLTAPILATRSLTMRQRYARTVLRCLGVRAQVQDERLQREPGGVLMVAGHVSWIDVLVLSAVAPSSFVARADMLDWGLLGRLARRMRIIPIDRANLRALPDTVGVVRDRLAAGQIVAAFPEATTWCGRAYGRLRPAMFQAAVDAQCPAQPVGIRYEDERGELCTGPCFVGAETMGASILRSLRQRGIVARVRLAPLEEPGLCRRDLARRCEEAVRETRQVTSLAAVA